MAKPLARRPVQARALRTREHLLRAAAQEFSTRGFAATTSKSIAARAKVGTGSFYQYFGNKESMLLELAAARFERVTHRALGSLPAANSLDSESEVRTALRAIVELVIELHREDPGLHAVFTERRHVDAALDRMTAQYEAGLVEQVTGWLQGWGFDGDRQATAFVLFGMLEGAVHSHVLGHALVSDARFVAALVDALFRVTQPLET